MTVVTRIAFAGLAAGLISIGGASAAGHGAAFCPNSEGGQCLGKLKAGTHKTVVFRPTLTYTVPAGWTNFEDTPGNFLLVPARGALPGVNAGTSDFIGVYTSVAAEAQAAIHIQQQASRRSRPPLHVGSPTRTVSRVSSRDRSSSVA